MAVTPLPERKSWQALKRHHQEIGGRHLRDLFADDPGRGERLTVEAAGIYLDYSKNRITDDTVRLLLDLAGRLTCRPAGPNVPWRAHQRVRRSSRAPRGSPHAAGELVVDGVDVVREVHAVLDAMTAFTERVRSGEWKGHTGKPIRNVVNVGIGGSDLGPVMAYEALRHYTRPT